MARWRYGTVLLRILIFGKYSYEDQSYRYMELSSQKIIIPRNVLMECCCFVVVVFSRIAWIGNGVYQDIVISYR